MSARVDARGWLIRLVGVAIVVCLSLSCGSSSQTMTSPGATRCALQVQTETTAFSPEGGGGALRISTARECAWTAQSQSGWLSVSSPHAGQGEGTVQFTVAPNAEPSARSGSIGINDERLQISQAGSPCELRLSSTHELLDATGGDRTVHVTASSAQCHWTASSGVPWIEVVSGREGNGSGAVTFHVNTIGELPRTGIVTVAGQAVHVEQAIGCSYTVNPTAFSLGADGGSGQVVVSAPPGCVWTAESQAPWITITNSAGSGAGLASFQAAPSGGAARSGTIVVAGLLVTVTQSPECSHILEPSTYTATAAGGPGAIVVRTGGACSWSAGSTVPWIAITAGHAGTGPGEVRFTVAAAEGAARTGSIRIGNQEVTVSQDQRCSFTAAPVSVAAAAPGGSGSIQVTAGAGCAWSATSGAQWITMSGPAGGVGSGQVAYVVAANTGPARQATLTVAGHAVAVTQASGCTYGLSPAAQDIPPTGGGGALGVTTAAGCAWSATGAAAWLTVSPVSGAGPAQVQLSANRNNGPSRSTTVTIAGRTATVNQASPCSWDFAPKPMIDVDANGSLGAVLVFVTGACSWTAESTAPWITVVAGATGTGDGMVQFQIAPNAGPARTGVVMIGGVPYSVSQRAR